VAKQAPDVFISHSLADSRFARELAQDLRRRGWTTFDSKTYIGPGEDWQTSSTGALSSAAAVVLLFSPAYASSPWSGLEIGLAIGAAEAKQSLLIPVLLPSSEPAALPARLGKYQGVGLQTLDEVDHLATVIDDALRKRLEQPESDYEHSAQLLERTLADSQRVLGPDHPSTLSTRANLANVFLQQGRLDEASMLLERTLADSQRVLGPDHPVTAALRVLLQRAGDAR
jgi:hypothetical protein